MAAFYYGFTSTQILGGYLAGRYGGKYLFGGGTLLSGLFTLTYPLAARTHVWALMAMRALQGFGEGVVMPACFVLNSKWLPESEQGLLTTVIYSGE